MTTPFDGITNKNKKKLLKLLHTQTLHLEKNSTFLNNLIDKDSIIIIVKGHIQIYKINTNGNSIIIEDLEEDNVFGNSILINDNDINIVAKEETTILLMDINSILNYTDTQKKFYNDFLKNMFLILNEKLNLTNERIKILTKKTIRNKLLEYFEIVSKKNGSKFIYLPYSFQALADYIAVDRSAMSRELKYLKEEGFIEIKGKRIKLLY